MFPHEARLRNLTYNSPLYCDISCKYEVDAGDRSQEEGVEAEEERENPKEFLGWVPIMLRSSFCVLVSFFIMVAVGVSVVVVDVCFLGALGVCWVLWLVCFQASSGEELSRLATIGSGCVVCGVWSCCFLMIRFQGLGMCWEVTCCW